MKTRCFLHAILLYLLLVGSTRSARAQNIIPNCALNPDCVSLFHQGRAQSGIGNFDEAFRLYTRAYAVAADPDLLFSIARVLHKRNSTAAAANYYRKFLASPSQAAEQRQKAKEYLRQIQTPR